MRFFRTFANKGIFTVMETIFDHNPTPADLRAIGCDWRPYEWNISPLDEETAWFDLAMLLHERGDAKNEARACSHIPERRDEFFRGFDYLEIES